VRTLLQLLVLACLLPAMVGVAVILFRDYQDGRAQIVEDAVQTARALVRIVDAEFNKAEILGQALATSSYLDQRDLSGFHGRASGLLASTNIASNAVLTGPDGRQIINTLRPFGEPLPMYGDPAVIGQVLASGLPTISGVFAGGLSGAPKITVNLPVLAKGKVVYVLSVGVLPEQLHLILHRQNLAAGWVISIFDNSGIIAARIPGHAQNVGKKANDELIARITGPLEGTFESVTKEGVPAVLVYSRSPVSRWSVAIAVPRQALEARLIRKQIITAIVALLLFAATAGLAWSMGGQISDSVQALTAAAKKLGSGEPIAPSQSHFREAAEVASAMQGASALLAERRGALLELKDQLEIKVAERTKELSAANNELGSFAYAVSHDLRAPLRAMSGFSQVLLDDHGDKLDATAKGYLQQIDNASKRMGELIEGILALSRSTQGDLQREKVDISAMAERQLREFALSEPARPVKWSVEPELTAVGDRRMVEAVMSNLLGNAWKYTGKTNDACIRVHAGLLDGAAAICVTDNGAGFDMAHAKQLFQPFRRLHRQDEFVGIGIGLATVQRIVRRHGGEIRAESAPGAGATFCFTLAGTPSAGAS